MVSLDEPRRRFRALILYKEMMRSCFRQQMVPHPSDVAEIVVDELDETVKPHVLDETPTVFSIGRRCMKMGYAFHW